MQSFFEGFEITFKGRNSVNRDGFFYGISPQKEFQLSVV